MVYTQTSLSLVYNLERVFIKSTLLLCHLSIWNCRLLAFRAKKLLYQTILTTPPLLFWAGSQLWQWLSGSLFSGSFVLCAAFLLLGVVCVPLALLLGVGGWQISLRAGVQLWLRMWEVTLLPHADQTMALCSVVVVIRA